MTSIARAEREVQAAINRVQRSVPDAVRPLVEVETAVWSALLALGRALVGLYLARVVARERPAVYEQGGTRYRVDVRGGRRSQLGTRFGRVPFVRPVGRPVDQRGACDLPVDRELGLCGGFSLGVVTAICRLCAQLAFAGARGTFREFHQWSPSSRAVLRMVDTVGEHGRRFLEQLPAPEDDGQILVIQVDGRGAPMITGAEYERRRRPKRRRTDKAATKRATRRLRRRERPRVRRTKGKKSKNAKLAVIGVIYTLRHTRQGLEGPVNKRLYGTFESHEALFQWLRKEAKKRGYGRKRTLFLGDGSEHIWRNQRKYFPQAEPCLDWYHVSEKLWTAGETQFAEGSGELKLWVDQMAQWLRTGQITKVLRTLITAYRDTSKTGPGTKGRRDRLRAVIRYLFNHRHRMPYARFRADDLDIGTGVVEGAMRNVIGIRHDGPGMRWSLDRAERVLHLRCILVSGLWDQFADYLAATPLKLAAQPRPTRPHDAVPNPLAVAA